jgi:hypothetical protein
MTRQEVEHEVAEALFKVDKDAEVPGHLIYAFAYAAFKKIRELRLTAVLDAE